MNGLLRTLGVAVALAFVVGCHSTPGPNLVRGQKPVAFAATQADEVPPKSKPDSGAEKDEEDKPPEKAEGPPKTLFEWTVGPKPESENDDEAEEEPIVTDRPDFTEASSTVGRGRVQLEAGYTYFRDRFNGIKNEDHTYPEALLRVGVLADWFELRFGQTYARSRSRTPDFQVESLAGLSDFYVGTKLGLTEQKGHLPEMALVLQALVPTGAEDFTNDRVLLGFNLLYGWDVIPDFLTAGGSTQVNQAVDDEKHSFVVLAQSFTIGYTLTEQLGAYTEWFALIPTSAIAPDVTPEHYFDGGFTYKVTPNFQLDIRAGVGLNRHAQDFFVGTGFAVRY